MTKILIVDHIETSLNHLGALLTGAAYEVALAATLKEAQRQVLNWRPDICIIDPKNPEGDGFILSLKIRKKFPRMGIIISTADFKGEFHKNEAKTKYGASAFLEKPYSDEKLVRIVKALWERIEARKTQARLKMSAMNLEKRQTIPGMSLSGMDLDSTIGVPPSAISAHIEGLKDQLVIKPKAGDSLIEALSILETSGPQESLPPLAPPASSPLAKPQPAKPPLEEARNAALLLEKTVADPFAIVDDHVASSFAQLEQSAQQAADSPPAFQPEDTLITGTPGGDFRLTADEIFGSLINDIESGKVRRPPAAKRPVEPDKGPDEITAGDQEPMFAVGADTNPNISPQGILPPSPDRTDKYELIELINEDQAFEVWKAKIKGENGFERLMALKKIKSYLSDNLDLNHLFFKEAKLAAALSHPNIAQIYELGMYEGSRFLSREFLQGESLQSLLMRCRAKNTNIPAPIVAYLGAKIADALAYAHKAQGLDGQPLDIVHHHLSPDNVIITDEGEVKVLNFGTGQVAARAAGTDMVPHEQLQSLAPEQAAGTTSLDHRVDVFSLGSLLYRALTGLDPFTGTGRESVMLKIREADSAPIHLIRPELPMALSEIVSKAMQVQPDNRYQFADEIASDLRGYLKKSSQRTDESDVTVFLRVLRAGIDLDSPSLMASGPYAITQAPPAEVVATSSVPRGSDSFNAFDTANDEQPQSVFPSATPADEPIKFEVAPPAAPATPKSLVALVVLLVLILLGLLAWRFLGESPSTPAPVQSEPVTSQPVEPEPAADLPSEPSIEPSTVEDVQTQPTPSTTGTKVPDPELLRLEEELRQKQELLKKLNDGKGP